MDKAFREEWLSAYLDGELDATEEERVVKWLGEDPRAQEMLRDFQQLRETLRELPTLRLEKNLTQSVLEQINTQSEDLTPVAAMHSLKVTDCAGLGRSEDHALAMDLVAPQAYGSLSPNDKQPADSNRRRMYLWPAVAVAAALLLMVFSSQEPMQEERSVVRSESRVTASSPVEKKSPALSADPLLSESTLSRTEIAAGDQRLMRAAPTQEAKQFGAKALAKRRKIAEETEALEGQSSRAADRAGQASLAEGVRTTYFFRTAPELDIKKQLERALRGGGEVEIMDLGSAYEDARFSETRARYHIFELHGSSEATHKAIETLQNTEGLYLDKTPKDPQLAAVQPETMDAAGGRKAGGEQEPSGDKIKAAEKREDSLEFEADNFTKKGVPINCIRLIFDLGPDKPQTPKR